MEIFLSYAREDRESAGALADDLGTLGHQVWLDQKLRGGQDWWDEILVRLRSCHFYVYVLSPAALKSQACEAELDYAVALRRPLLPVKVREVSTNVLPRPLAQAQHVDYTSPDKAAAFGLATSLNAMPEESPRPEPLPPEPELPLAPLHEAKARVDSTEQLSRAEQLELLDRLRHATESEDQREDARELFMQFRERRDIIGDIRDDVDAVLASLAFSPADPALSGARLRGSKARPQLRSKSLNEHIAGIDRESRFWARRALKALRSELENDEVVFALTTVDEGSKVTGMGANGALAITDRRLLFVNKEGVGESFARRSLEAATIIPPRKFYRLSSIILKVPPSREVSFSPFHAHALEALLGIVNPEFPVTVDGKLSELSEAHRRRLEQHPGLSR